MGECCLDKDKVRHDEEEIYKALGLSDDDKGKVDTIVNEALSKRKISEMLEHIWSEKCEELSLEARIYATFRLGMDIYSLLIGSMIARREREVDKAGQDAPKAA